MTDDFTPPANPPAAEPAPVRIPVPLQRLSHTEWAVIAALQCAAHGGTFTITRDDCAILTQGRWNNHALSAYVDENGTVHFNLDPIQGTQS